MVKSTIKDYFSSTQCDRIVCQNRDGINVLPFNQLTDKELASDLNNEKMDTKNNVQDKKSETMDTDFLNTQMKVCISTKTTLTKISIIQKIFLLFISTYVAYQKI